MSLPLHRIVNSRSVGQNQNMILPFPQLNSLNNPSIVLKENVLYLDASKNGSYPESGSTWYDISGRNNHAQLVGSVNFNNNSMEISESFSLTNASSNYIRLDSSYNDLRITGNKLTIECWLKVDTPGIVTYPSIVSHRVSYNSGESYSLLRNEKTLNGEYVFSLNTSVTGSILHDFSVVPSFGNWDYIAVTYDGSKVRSFKDGVEVGVPTTVSGNIIDKNVNTYIGAMYAQNALHAAFYKHMNIGVVRISKEALSVSDIVTNYNIEKQIYS